MLCGHISAKTAETAVLSDTISTKMEIKKMDFKNAGNDTFAKSVRKKIKPAGEELKAEIRNDLPPIDVKLQKNGNNSTVNDIKNSAKRTGKTPAKQTARPAVSYPSYPGGNVAIRNFVKKNQKYPEECKKGRLRGRVEVIVAIAPDGTPHSATISKSSGNVYMDAEALRVADLMPKWTPAPESDDPQGVDHVIFFNFRPGR